MSKAIPPSVTQREKIVLKNLQLATEMLALANKLMLRSKPLPPEFQKIVDEKFWELLR